MVGCTMCGLASLLFGCIQTIIECVMTSKPALFVLSVFISVLIVLHVYAGRQICENRRGGPHARAAIYQVARPCQSPCFSRSSAGSCSIAECSERATTPMAEIMMGQNQSPINIINQFVQKYPIHELLTWTHYNDIPQSVSLENTGRTVKMRACYARNTPTLCGADLLESYSFVELCFRWSMFNSEGSEHMLNYKKFPLELQVMHRMNLTDDSPANYDLLMVSYFYEIINDPNPFLNPIVMNLNRIQKPNTRVEIPPFPLSYLCHMFRTGFYSYGGSLTEPPCDQGAEWFIFPEPLAISLQQLNEFRQLLSHDGKNRIISNARPVQTLSCTRAINLNQFNPCDVPPTREQCAEPQCEDEEEPCC